MCMTQCVRSNQRVSESWTFLKLLQIHNRERLCLKPLPQFSSHPNETCYIKSIWRVDVHHVLVWGLTQRFQGYVPFFKTLICAYREGVLIFFHSFQVNNMISFILAYRLWQSEKVEYLPQWIIALFFFLTSKPIFQNSNLQYTTSFWAVWKWSMSLLKQLKSRSFRGFSAPCSSDQGCPGPTVGITAPWPPAPFSGFKVRSTFSPVWWEWVVHVDKSDTPISGSSPHPVAESLLKHWFSKQI